MPIWKDDALIADETVDYGHGDARGAGASSQRSPTLLGVDAEHAMPAYEDVWYYLWRERRLPVNVDPLQLEPEGRRGARAALARIFEQGLDHVVGYVLPLQRIHASRRRPRAG